MELLHFVPLNSTTTLAPATENPTEAPAEEMSSSIKMIIGILLVIVGEVIPPSMKKKSFFNCSFQFFHGVQFVYESKYLTKYNIPPLKVVGLEGEQVFLPFTNISFPSPPPKAK